MKPVRIEPYGALLYVAHTPSEWRRFKRFDSDLGGASGMTQVVGSRRKGREAQIHVGVFVYKKLFKGDRPELVNTIAHEATHAATILLDRVGQRYDGESEALAYLSGWIAGQVWKELHSA